MRSWSGGENSIEVGGGSVGVKRAEVRDTWDQDLDRGKVRGCNSLARHCDTMVCSI